MANRWGQNITTADLLKNSKQYGLIDLDQWLAANTKELERMSAKNNTFFGNNVRDPREAEKAFQEAAALGDTIHNMQRAILSTPQVLSRYGFGRPMVRTSTKGDIELFFLPTDSRQNIPANSVPTYTIPRGQVAGSVSGTTNRYGMPGATGMSVVRSSGGHAGITLPEAIGIDLGVNMLQKAPVFNKGMERRDLEGRAKYVQSFISKAIREASHTAAVISTKSSKEDMQKAYRITDIRPEGVAAITGQLNLSHYYKQLFNAHQQKVRANNRGGPASERAFYKRLDELMFGFTNAYKDVADIDKYVAEADPWIFKNIWKGDLEHLYKDLLHRVGTVQGTKKAGISSLVSLYDVPIAGAPLSPLDSNKIAKNLRIFQTPIKTIPGKQGVKGGGKHLDLGRAAGANITTTAEQRAVYDQIYGRGQGAQNARYKLYYHGELTDADVLWAAKSYMADILNSIPGGRKTTPDQITSRDFQEFLKGTYDKYGDKYNKPSKIVTGAFKGVQSDASLYADQIHKDLNFTEREVKTISEDEFMRARQNQMNKYVRERYNTRKGKKKTDKKFDELTEQEKDDFMKSAGIDFTKDVKLLNKIEVDTAREVFQLRDVKTKVGKIQHSLDKAGMLEIEIGHVMDNDTFTARGGGTKDFRTTTSNIADVILGKAFEHAGYRKKDIYKNGKDVSGGLRMTIASEKHDMSYKKLFEDFMDPYHYIVSEMRAGGKSLDEIVSAFDTYTYNGKTPFKGLIKKVSTADKLGGIDFNNNILTKILSAEDTSLGTDFKEARLVQAMIDLGIQQGIYNKSNAIKIGADGSIEQNRPIVTATEFGRSAAGSIYEGVGDSNSTTMTWSEREIESLENTAGLFRARYGAESAMAKTLENHALKLRSELLELNKQYQPYKRSVEAMKKTFVNNAELAYDEISKFGAIITPEERAKYFTDLEYDAEHGTGGVIGDASKFAATQIRKKADDKYAELEKTYGKEYLAARGIKSGEDIQVFADTGDSHRLLHNYKGKTYASRYVPLAQGNVTNVEGYDDISMLDAGAVANQHIISTLNKLDAVDPSNGRKIRELTENVMGYQREYIQNVLGGELFDKYNKISRNQGGTLRASAANEETLKFFNAGKGKKVDFLMSKGAMMSMLMQKKAGQLREVAKQMGLKGVSKASKSKLAQAIADYYDINNKNYQGGRMNSQLLMWRSPTLKDFDDIVGLNIALSDQITDEKTLLAAPSNAAAVKLDFDGDRVAIDIMNAVLSGDPTLIRKAEQEASDYAQRMKAQQSSGKKAIGGVKGKSGTAEDLARARSMEAIARKAAENQNTKNAGIYGDLLKAIGPKFNELGLGFNTIRTPGQDTRGMLAAAITNAIPGALYQEGINIKNLTAEQQALLANARYLALSGATWGSVENMMGLLDTMSKIGTLQEGGKFKANVAANLGFTGATLTNDELDYLNAAAEAALSRNESNTDIDDQTKQERAKNIQASIQSIAAARRRVKNGRTYNDLNIGKEILAEIAAGDVSGIGINSFLLGKSTDGQIISMPKLVKDIWSGGVHEFKDYQWFRDTTDKDARTLSIAQAAAMDLDKGSSYYLDNGKIGVHSADRLEAAAKVLANTDSAIYTSASTIKKNMLPENQNLGKMQDQLNQIIFDSVTDEASLQKKFDEFSRLNPDVMKIATSSFKGLYAHAIAEIISNSLKNGQGKTQEEIEKDIDAQIGELNKTSVAYKGLQRLLALQGLTPEQQARQLGKAEAMGRAQGNIIQTLLGADGQVIGSEIPLLGVSGNALSYDIADIMFGTTDKNGRATLNLLDYKNRYKTKLDGQDLIQELQYFNDILLFKNEVAEMITNENGQAPTADAFFKGKRGEYTQRLYQRVLDMANSSALKQLEEDEKNGITYTDQERSAKFATYQRDAQQEGFAKLYSLYDFLVKNPDAATRIMTSIASDTGHQEVVSFNPNSPIFQGILTKIAAGQEFDENEKEFLEHPEKYMTVEARASYSEDEIQSVMNKYSDIKGLRETRRDIESAYNDLYDSKYKLWELDQKMAKEPDKTRRSFLGYQKEELEETLKEQEAVLEYKKLIYQDSPKYSKLLASSEKKAEENLKYKKSFYSGGIQQNKAGLIGGTESLIGNFLGRFISGYGLQRLFSKIIQAFSKLIAEATALDKAMANLRIVTGQNKEDTRRLINEYANLGKSIGATTAEISNSAVGWLRQGYESAEVLDLVKSSMYLSKLGMMDAATATQSLTSALKGFKLQATESMDVVDKLTAIDLKAATSAGEIAQGLAQFANVGSLMGVNIDQAAAYVATIADVTQMSGSSAGQALKTIISRYGNVKAGAYNKLNIQSEGSDETVKLNDVERVLNKLGVSIRDTNLQFKDFDDILEEIASKWNTLDTVSQKAIATAFAGVRQQEAFVTLLQNWDKYQELEETAEHSKGTAEKKYASYRESLEASKNSLTAALQEFVNKGEVSETIRKFLDALTKIAEKLPDIIYWASQIFFQVQNFRAFSGNSIIQKGMNRIWGGKDGMGGLSKYFGGFFSKGAGGKAVSLLEFLGGSPKENSAISYLGQWASTRDARKSLKQSFLADQFMFKQKYGSMSPSDLAKLQGDQRSDFLSYGKRWGKDENGVFNITKSAKDFGKEMRKNMRDMSQEVRGQLALQESISKETNLQTLQSKYQLTNEQMKTMEADKQRNSEQLQTTEESKQLSMSQTETIEKQKQLAATQSASASQAAGSSSSSMKGLSDASTASGVAGGASAASGAAGGIIGIIISIILNQVMAGISAYESNGLTHTNARGEQVQSSKSTREQTGVYAAVIAGAVPILGGMFAKLYADSAAAKMDKERDDRQILINDANAILKEIKTINTSLQDVKENLSSNDTDALKEMAEDLLDTIFAGGEESDIQYRSRLTEVLTTNGALSGGKSLSDFILDLGSDDPEVRRKAYTEYMKAQAALNTKSVRTSSGAGIFETQQALADKNAEARTNIAKTKGARAATWGLLGAAVSTMIGIPGLSAALPDSIYEAPENYKGRIVASLTDGTITADNVAEKLKLAEETKRNLEAQAAAGGTMYSGAGLKVKEESIYDSGIIDDVSTIVDYLRELKEQYEYQTKQADKAAVEEAYYKTEINGTTLDLIKETQLYSISQTELYTAVANELAKTGYSKDIWDSTGQLTSEAIADITTILKKNDETASYITRQNQDISKLLSTLNASDQFDKETLKTLANALGVSVDYLVKHSDDIQQIFGTLTLSDLTLSTQELLDKQQSYSDLLGQIGDKTGSTSAWMSTIISQFPELIGYMSDSSTLITKIILKTKQLGLAQYTSQWEEIARNKDIYTLMTGGGKFNTTKEDTGFTTFADIFNSGKYTEDEVNQMKKIIEGSGRTDLYGLREYLTGEGYKLEGAKQLIEVTNQVGAGLSLVNDQYKTLISKWLEYHSKELEKQLNNLEEQKNMLQQINQQREYENKLIEAQLKLENALNEKKMVYRAGIGFVYEADQSAIKEAQENLEQLDYEKEASTITQQMLDLQTEKNAMDEIFNKLNNEELKEISDDFEKVFLQGGSLYQQLGDTFNPTGLSQQISDVFGLLGGIAEDFSEISANGISILVKDQNPETEEGSGNMLQDNQDTDTMEAINYLKEREAIFKNQGKSMEERMQAIDEYKEKYNQYGPTLMPEDINNTYNQIKDFDTNRKAIRTNYTINNAATENQKAFVLQEVNWGDLDSYGHNTNDFKEWVAGDLTSRWADKNTDFAIWSKEHMEPESIKHYVSKTTLTKLKNQKFKDAFDVLKYIINNADSHTDQLWNNNGDFEIILGGTANDDEFILYKGNKNNLSSSSVTQIPLKILNDAADKGSSWKNDTNILNNLNSVTGHKSGIINVSNAEIAKINELGTEAIITPSGVVTALPSHSGVVPADITKNLWALGEVAPAILRLIGPSLTPDHIGKNSTDNIVDESFNVSTINMNVTADDTFDAEAFVESIKDRVNLTKNMRR